MVAASTDLRRGELEKIQRRDVIFEGDLTVIHARATTTKNYKKASLPLRHDAVQALRLLKSTQAHASGTRSVFHKLPRIKRYRHDLEAVGIPYKDEGGKVFDFHALRVTYGTHLQKSGVSIPEAMQLMRHMAPKLTTKIYTGTGQLPLRAAVLKLGSVDTTPDTRADTQ